MKKILLILSVFAAAFSLFACSKRADGAVQTYDDGNKYVFLVCGFDDAAENTDVIFTVSYDKDENTARIAQIPRDTYYNFGKSQNKINQIYAALINEGKSQDEALSEASAQIAELFGTEFDGYVGVSLETFRETVDAIGGVDMYLPEDLTVYPEGDGNPVYLKAGINHIDGKLAESFVRYRSGYALGDLARIDAQKLFINSLFIKLSSGVSLPSLIKLATVFQSKVVTDVKLCDVLPIFIDALKSDKKQVFYATVPGEPAESGNGLSFYVLNRKSAAEIAKRYMYSKEEFDKNFKCLDKNSYTFKNIYLDDSIKIREFSGEELSELRIIQR